MSKAVWIIRDEHRRYGAVLNMVRNLLKQAGAAGEGVDGELVESAFDYVEEFIDTFHHPKEDAYLFRPGRAPPCRQMFYRFKDLLVEEAQRLMAANLKTSAEAECDEKNGWFASGTDAQLREVLNECINRDLDEPAANGEGAGREAAGIGVGGGRKNDEEEESDSTDSDDGLP